MAVGLRLKFPDGKQEEYDAIHAHIDVDANPPAGMIFHSAGPIDGGWGVIDVWESRAAFDSFAGERLMHAIAELGDRALQGPPDIKEFPVYHYTTP